jgi:hypothetical protein
MRPRPVEKIERERREFDVRRRKNKSWRWIYRDTTNATKGVCSIAEGSRRVVSIAVSGSRVWLCVA